MGRRTAIVAVEGVEWSCRGEGGVGRYWSGAAGERQEYMGALSVHSRQ